MYNRLDGALGLDPDLRPAAPGIPPHGAVPLPEAVDVLIVGAGPAGMLLAAQLAQFPSISTRLVERRQERLQMGQADGVAPRTVEMFQAFGLGNRLMQEGYHGTSFMHWGTDDADNAQIVRKVRAVDMPDGISEFPHIMLGQARIQAILEEYAGKSPTRFRPDFGYEVLSVDVADEGSHPVNVTMRRTLPDGGVTEVTLRAKYVIGCDGAHSTIRRSMGLSLDGDPQNHAWGVLDVFVNSDFPDIAYKAMISRPEGNLGLLPRESEGLLRIYVDMGAMTSDRGDLRATTTADDIIAVAQDLLRPYTLDVRHVHWWSLYEVGQRYAARFDNVPAEERGSRQPRVFIAGDACHTHSAKAGQGMNVSMADTYNLGWKLAAVLEGRSPASLLDTYNEERQPIARELIEFDRTWARIMSGENPDGTPVTADQRHHHMTTRRGFMAGVRTHYGPSMVMGEPVHEYLARGFQVGERFHSAPVVRLADGLAMELGHAHEADGRWRIYLFGDSADPRSDTSRLAATCEWLEHDHASPVIRFTPPGADLDAAFDVRAVLPFGVDDLSVVDLPSLLSPVRGPFGLRDLRKSYVTDTDGEDIFDARGVDREHGCIVVVRPDQIVAHVLPLDARQELNAFFEGLLIPRTDLDRTPKGMA